MYAAGPVRRGKRKYSRAFGSAPYSRRTRGRNFGSGRGGFKRRSSFASLHPRPEFKTNRGIAAAQAVDDAGVFVLMNGLQLGDAFDDRQGRMITMKSINTNMTVTMHASADSTQFRAMLILDTQPNGALPALSDILQFGSVPPVIGQRSVSTIRRFWVIKDKYMSMSSAGKNNFFYKHYKRFNVQTRYDASTAGDITDISKNSLFWLFLSNEDTNTPTLELNSQIKYIDN